MGLRTHIRFATGREAHEGPVLNQESDPALAAHLRALSRVSAATLHDLRTPLHTIVLYLELLRGSLAEDSPSAHGAQNERYIGVIGSEIQRLERMLEALMAQLRLAGAADGRHELCAAVSGLVAFLEPYAGRKHVRIGLSVPEEPVHVQAARDPIQRALVQFLMAGIDSASPGTLDVEVRAEGRNAIVSIVCIPASSEATEDSLALGRHTDPSETERDLLVSRLAVEHQGGRIRIETINGRGIRYELSVPLNAERR